MMELRRLQQGDAELAQQAIDRLKVTNSDLRRGPALDYLRGFLQNPDNVLIVATDEGVPIGFVLAYVVDRVDRDHRMMLFYEVEVAERHRRRGVARAMVELLKSLCAQRNVCKMWVYTNRSNAAAVGLYESTGGAPDRSGDEISFRYDWGPMTP